MSGVSLCRCVISNSTEAVVSPVQRCHGGKVVNACWREGVVPSLEMAACLGCSGLCAHLVDGAAGVGRQGRC